jgi:hypothetical protein
MKCLMYLDFLWQVGTVTALNFCLALRPPLLKMTPEFVNFLQDALQIAEADETVWVTKLMSPKVVTTLNQLRTACIELLCTAMAWNDLRAPSYNELRAKIIAMFFKSLTCRTPEIVAVAKEGLRQVIILHICCLVLDCYFVIFLRHTSSIFYYKMFIEKRDEQLALKPLDPLLADNN